MADSRRENPREVAMEVLVRIEKDGAYSNIALSRALEESSLSGPDRGLAAELVYGVSERRRTLDWYLSRLVKKGYNRLDGRIKAVLRMGAYQILFLDRVPVHAVCDESVKLAKKAGGQRLGGFVNGVLRSLDRQREELRIALLSDGGFAERHSLSDSLAERLKSEFGETAAIVAEGLCRRRGITLFINTLKIGASELMSRFAEAGISAASVDFSERDIPEIAAAMLEIGPGEGDVAGFPGFSDGLFFVQDPASAAAVSALSPSPGESVLDMCAAPGGKSFAAAILMEDRGRILALDLYESRVELIREGAARLGLSSVEARTGDALELNPALEGRFDRVICDVPCSGVGVLGKKPEIRYKDPADFGELPAIQRRLLENAVRYAKPGGRVVYSTCTVFRDENRDVVDSVLASSDGVRVITERALFPHLNESDGFYYCLLEKVR